MTDREKVIKWLEKCRRCECDDCTEKGASKVPWDCPAYDDFVDSALVLLKEQEAIEPDVYSEGTCMCGNCGMTVGYYPAGCSTPRKLSKYCPECGREVKWE